MIIRLLVHTVLLLLVAYFYDGVQLSGVYSAVFTVLLLGLLNMFVRPILLFLSLPITILTFGLFTFIINGVLFWLASTIIKGFDVSGFWAAVIGALLYTATLTIYSVIREEFKK